jgi:nucleotide-binding universal stress UspA family protein
MMTLVPVDGSQSSVEALKYAARRRPNGQLLVLHVAPSGKPVDLERGRFLLEESRRTLRSISAEVSVETRLEVGEPRSKVHEVATTEECDLVVMGAHGVNGLPHVDRVSADACEMTEDLQRPVVMVLPTGKGISAPAAAHHEAA